MDAVKPNNALKFVLVTVMLAAVAALRLVAYVLPQEWPIVPYLYNFAPVTALALFGGAKFGRWEAAFLIPLAAMVASDVLLHFLGFARLETGVAVIQQLSTYAFFLGVVGIGRLLRNREGVPQLLLATVTSTFGFWVVSNFVYWLLVSDTVAEPQFNYAKTFEGLMACYAGALPFLRNPMIGDLCYVGALFGGYAIISHLAKSGVLRPRVALD